MMKINMILKPVIYALLLAVFKWLYIAFTWVSELCSRLSEENNLLITYKLKNSKSQNIISAHSICENLRILFDVLNKMDIESH